MNFLRSFARVFWICALLVFLATVVLFVSEIAKYLFVLWLGQSLGMLAHIALLFFVLVCFVALVFEG